VPHQFRKIFALHLGQFLQIDSGRRLQNEATRYMNQKDKIHFSLQPLISGLDPLRHVYMYVYCLIIQIISSSMTTALLRRGGLWVSVAHRYAGGSVRSWQCHPQQAGQRVGDIRSVFLGHVGLGLEHRNDF
jgi:hypothetical protein